LVSRLMTPPSDEVCLVVVFALNVKNVIAQQ